MTNFIYAAKIEQDEDGFFLVSFRDFPFAATDGRTIGEAMNEATDCLEEAVASCIEDGEPVPMPSRSRKNEVLIMLPSLMSAKAALHNAVEEEGIMKTSLAKLLDASEKEGRRWLDPRHNTKITTLEKALGVLGRKLVVGVEMAPMKAIVATKKAKSKPGGIKKVMARKATKAGVAKRKAIGRIKKAV